MFALVVRFEVRPDRLAEFDQLAAETLTEIQLNDPGTLIYLIHQRADRPHERVFYEAYADTDAFDAHESAAHTRRFLAEREAMLAAEPEVWRLTGLDGAIRTADEDGPA